MPANSPRLNSKCPSFPCFKCSNLDSLPFPGGQRLPQPERSSLRDSSFPFPKEPLGGTWTILLAAWGLFRHLQGALSPCWTIPITKEVSPPCPGKEAHFAFCSFKLLLRPGLCLEEQRKLMTKESFALCKCGPFCLFRFSWDISPSSHLLIFFVIPLRAELLSSVNSFEQIHYPVLSFCHHLYKLICIKSFLFSIILSLLF